MIAAPKTPVPASSASISSKIRSASSSRPSSMAPIASTALSWATSSVGAERLHHRDRVARRSPIASSMAPTCMVRPASWAWTSAARPRPVAARRRARGALERAPLRLARRRPGSRRTGSTTAARAGPTRRSGSAQSSSSASRSAVGRCRARAASSTVAATSPRVAPVAGPSCSSRSNARPSVDVGEDHRVEGDRRRASSAARHRGRRGHVGVGDDVLDVAGEVDHLQVAALDRSRSPTGRPSARRTASASRSRRQRRSRSTRLPSSVRIARHRLDLRAGRRGRRRRVARSRRPSSRSRRAVSASSPALDQLHLAELAHRLEQPVAQLARALDDGDQRLVDQARQRHRARRRRRPRRRRASEKPSRKTESRRSAVRSLVVEQVPAPVDDREQGLVPLGRVARRRRAAARTGPRGGARSRRPTSPAPWPPPARPPAAARRAGRPASAPRPASSRTPGRAAVARSVNSSTASSRPSWGSW